MQFDEGYAESIVLSGGVRAQIRLVRASDKTVLAAGLAALSAESRFLRFFMAKDRFNAEELRYLTEIDGVRHVAIGAIEIADDGTERGLGIARFVRHPEFANIAEPALVVLDEVQREGLGTLLCERLVAAARERGIDTFRFEVLAENAAIRALVRELCPDAVERADGDTVSIEVPLPEHTPIAATGDPLSRLLAIVAAPVEIVRRALDGVAPTLNLKKR